MEWRRLRRHFPDLLGGREMIVRSVELQGKGTSFRVFTGPFADDAMAESSCEALKTRRAILLGDTSHKSVEGTYHGI